MTPTETGRRVPCTLTSGKAAVGAYGCTPTAFAGGAWDGLVAFELQPATFCARDCAPCPLELLLLCFRCLVLFGRAARGSSCGSTRRLRHSEHEAFSVKGRGVVASGQRLRACRQCRERRDDGSERRGRDT